MAWSSSDRKRRFNPGWARTRRIVLERDGYRCQWVRADTGLRCGLPAHEVDHRRRALNGVDDDRLSNLWALCPYHHKQKTAAESGEARRLKRERGREAEWYSHPAFRAV